MSNAAHVNSIQALKSLAYFLPLFQARYYNDISNLEKIVNTCLDEINELKMKWLTEFNMHEKEIKHAQAAIAALIATNYFVPVTAYYAIPGYLVMMQKLAESQKKQKRSQENIERINYWLARIQDSFNEFKLRTSTAKEKIEEVIPKGSAFLDKCVGELEFYMQINS